MRKLKYIVLAAAFSFAISNNASAELEGHFKTNELETHGIIENTHQNTDHTIGQDEQTELSDHSIENEHQKIQEKQNVHTEQIAEQPSHSDAPRWGYTGRENPSKWALLSEEFSLCSKGNKQSPIDIDHKAFGALHPQIKFLYKETAINLSNNGHTIQLNYEPGSFIKIAEEQYELLQVHFHSPSEHTVEGKHYYMEMHLVHKNKLGQLAVIGLFIKKGKDNRAFKDIWENFPIKANHASFDEVKKVNARSLLPLRKDYYHYSGSLTTPPCSEGVQWFVMKNPIELSEKQITEFISFIDYNSRPVQPLNDRGIF